MADDTLLSGKHTDVIIRISDERGAILDLTDRAVVITLHGKQCAGV